MIYAELSGGLGNQMFIYAFARALSMRCNEPLTLLDRQDWRDGAPAHTVCALEALSISPEVTICAEPGFAKKHLPRQNTAKALMIKYEQRRGFMARDYNDFERRMAPLLNTLGLHFATDGYVPVRRGGAKDFLAWGYFQAAEYFADEGDTIRAELRAREKLADADATTAEAAQKIKASPCAVCLHVRRGDYAKPENAALQVCTTEYYAAACAQLKKDYPQAELFAFSDDIAWVRDNLDTADLPVTYMGGARTAVQDLALMQSCRHFVLSNSTFSWWAQYLGDASDKTVYAPDRWYANVKKSALYAPDWRLIATR